MAPRLTDLYSSPRPITITVANLQDLDSIVETPVATVAAADVIQTTDFDGDDVASNVAYPLHAHIPSGQSVEMGVPMYPTATSSSSAASYVLGSHLVWTGTYGGAPATSTATVTDADGNETIVGDTPLDSVSSCAVEAQADTNGSWTMGFQDLGPNLEGGVYNPACRGLRATEEGNIACQDADGHLNVTPFAAAEFQPLGPHRINFTNTSVTTLTLYR